MLKWEYSVINKSFLHIKEHVEWLNVMGSNGWDLVSEIRIDEDAFSIRYHHVFKRLLNQDTGK